MSKLLVADYTLFAVLAVAAVSDVRYRKVRNWLTVPAMVVGLLFALFHANGRLGVVDSLKGLAILLLVGLLAWGIGIIGGGDAKLLAVVGSFVGNSGAGGILMWSALTGGVMALIVVFVRNGVVGGLKRIASGFGTMWVSKTVIAGAIDEKAERFPYSLAIAVGTLIWMFAH